MKKITKELNFEIYDNAQELPEDEQNLIVKAREAMKHAYSPYSNFKVGAAVLLTSGEIVIGSNQENVVYGPSNCGERSALFAVGSQGKGDQITKIAVIGRHELMVDTIDSLEQEKMGSPCGVCRQVIKEYEDQSGKPFVILCVTSADRVYRTVGVENYLPFPFGPKDLG